MSQAQTRPDGWARLHPGLCAFDDRIGLYDAEAADLVRRFLRHDNAYDVHILSTPRREFLCLLLSDLGIEELNLTTVRELVAEQIAEHESMSHAHMRVAADTQVRDNLADLSLGAGAAAA